MLKSSDFNTTRQVLPKLDLSLFGADGPQAAAAPAGEAAVEAAEHVAEPDLGVKEEKSPSDARRERRASLANDERRLTFEKMIQGEYKELFGQRVQSIIDKRFRETKDLERQNESLRPVLDKLSSRYGVSPDNLEALLQAIDDDEPILADAAKREGLSIRQYKALKQQEAQNARFKQQQEAAAKEQRKKQQRGQWMTQSKEVQGIYPTFDLLQELKHPQTGEQFYKLLNAGVDVRTAYEVTHRDEVIGGAMQYTAAKISKAVVNSVRSKQARPMENGVHSAQGFIVKPDVERMSREDRESIERRALKGERIRL